MDEGLLVQINLEGSQQNQDLDRIEIMECIQRKDLVAQLLSFGKTSDPADLFPVLVPEAAEIIKADPYAFAMAVCLDRGTKADIIWTIPYWILQDLGHLDPYKINQLSLEDLGKVVDKLPKRPRYRTAAPRTIKEFTGLVVTAYDGDASKIWVGKSAFEVKSVFQSIYGVGQGIANMSVLLIEQAYDMEFPDLDRRFMDIKPDVHTMRVLYRLGASEDITEQAAIAAAREMSPDYPGAIDGLLWTLGREYCFAHHPNCGRCPMKSVCAMVGLS